MVAMPRKAVCTVLSQYTALKIFIYIEIDYILYLCMAAIPRTAVYTRLSHEQSCG